MKQIQNEQFFEYVFGSLEGYLRLAVKDSRQAGDFATKWFEYPQDLKDILIFIDSRKPSHDIYFTPHLFTRRRGKKEYVAEAPNAWSDGDDCPIEELLLQPSVTIRTSEDRYSFLWKFKEVQPPDVAENVSKRIARFHRESGMDQSGWDLTQLLRVPNTFNFKYNPPQMISPAVVAEDHDGYLISDFEEYPDVEQLETNLQSLEELEVPDKDAEEILEAYSDSLNPKAYDLYSITPEKDWSSNMWNLELYLLEAGMPLEEAFVVVGEAACNKYRRDNRNPKFLWSELNRAKAKVEKRKSSPPEILDEEAYLHRTWDPPKVLTDEQREWAKSQDSFVERFSKWAESLGDAAPQYHPVGAFMILSSLLSGDVVLPASFGTMRLNLWFLILADTTLTRKSTAMGIAVSLLEEVDRDALLATDGSIEGLMSELALRSNRPSLFLRDEVTGLIDAVTNKGYMAGMLETLTKLYDGDTLKRILRKEKIIVRKPLLIFYAGGIREKMLSLLDQEHVTSGFLPRFIFVTAEADVTRVKPIGPPTQQDDDERDELAFFLNSMKAHYYREPVKSAEEGKVRIPKPEHQAKLTPEAWSYYNKIEADLVIDFAHNSHDPTTLTPMFDRLCKSGLKCAVLIAASENREEELIVTKDHIVHAFYYIEKWAEHMAYIVMNIGQSTNEQEIQRIFTFVKSNPGTLRSEIMQRYRLNSREAEMIFSTLEQRNAINREKRGARGERIHPTRR